MKIQVSEEMVQIRVKNLNLFQLEDSIKSLLSKPFVTNQNKRLRHAALVNPQTGESYYLKVKGLPSKFDQLLFLLLVVHLLDNEVLLFLFLGDLIFDYSKKFDPANRQLLLTISPSKDEVLAYLILKESKFKPDSEEWEFNERSFFSKISTAVENLARLSLRRSPHRKVVYPQFRRGYKDKGTLRPLTERLPGLDYDDIVLQNEIENERDEYSRYLDQLTAVLKEFLEDSSEI